MAADRWDEQVGTVADEAARLLESLRRTAQDDGPGAGDTADRHTAPAEGDHHAHPGSGASTEPGHDPFCQWCPLCRSAAVVRSLSPETLARLADLAVVAAGVLSDLAARGGAAAHSADGSEAPRPDDREPPDRGRRARTPPPSRPVPVVDAEEDPHA